MQTDTHSVTLRLKQTYTLSEWTQTDANMYPLTHRLMQAYPNSEQKHRLMKTCTDTQTKANMDSLNLHTFCHLAFPPSCFFKL